MWNKCSGGAEDFVPEPYLMALTASGISMYGANSSGGGAAFGKFYSTSNTQYKAFFITSKTHLPKLKIKKNSNGVAVVRIYTRTVSGQSVSYYEAKAQELTTSYATIALPESDYNIIIAVEGGYGAGENSCNLYLSN